MKSQLQYGDIYTILERLDGQVKEADMCLTVSLGYSLLTKMRRKPFRVTVRNFALLLGLQERALEHSLDHQRHLFL